MEQWWQVRVIGTAWPYKLKRTRWQALKALSMGRAIIPQAFTDAFINVQRIANSHGRRCLGPQLSWVRVLILISWFSEGTENRSLSSDGRKHESVNITQLIRAISANTMEWKFVLQKLCFLVRCSWLIFQNVVEVVLWSELRFRKQKPHSLVFTLIQNGSIVWAAQSSFDFFTSIPKYWSVSFDGTIVGVRFLAGHEQYSQ